MTAVWRGVACTLVVVGAWSAPGHGDVLFQDGFSDGLGQWTVEHGGTPYLATTVDGDGQPPPCALLDDYLNNGVWLRANIDTPLVYGPKACGRTLQFSIDLRHGNAANADQRYAAFELSNDHNPGVTVVGLDVYGSTNPTYSNAVRASLVYCTQGPANHVEFSPPLPIPAGHGNGDDWHHGLISIRPDGHAEFYLDDHLVYVSAHKVAYFANSIFHPGGRRSLFDNAKVELIDQVPEQPRLPGDGNCDGQVNFADIDYFVAAIPDDQSAWAALYAARHGGAQPTCQFLNNDVTGDGHVNFADIDPFAGLMGATCSRQWTHPTTPDPAPSPRYRYGMAYDSNRNVTVGFAGTDGTALGDTWEYDAGTNTWTRVSTSGPSPRWDFAMAYDAACHKTVVFGGRCESTPQVLGDTWVWDGSVWTQVSVSGASPAPRYGIGCSMVYDSARQVLVLFGGTTGSVPLGDTWEFDCTTSTWTQRATNGPAARWDASMTYDSALGVTVLFGGYDGEFYGDTWRWDGSVWTPVPAGGPSARAGSAIGYDSLTDQIVLFGGEHYPALDDTWALEFRCGSWTWTQLPAGPPARCEARMIYDSADRTFVMFGGVVQPGATPLGDTWLY